MAGYSSSLHRRGAYSFNHGTIEDLRRIIHEFTGGQVDVSVELSDNHTIESPEMDVFDDIYIRTKRITQIELESSNEGRRVWLQLKDVVLSEPVWFRLSGERDTRVLSY